MTDPPALLLVKIHSIDSPFPVVTGAGMSRGPSPRAPTPADLHVNSVSRQATSIFQEINLKCRFESITFLELLLSHAEYILPFHIVTILFMFALTVAILVVYCTKHSFSLLNYIRNHQTKRKISTLKTLNLPHNSFHRESSSISMLADAAALQEGFTYAFVGGTVGVMSVMLILEFQKIKSNTLEDCPYCMGNGEILCAACFGQGIVLNEACSCCSGRGLVICINCKGDGRETPIILQSKAVRDPEYAPDGISIDSP